MKIKEFTYLDRSKTIKMVKEILKDIFNGNPTQFSIIKEFNEIENYLLFLVVEDNNKIVGCFGLKKINKDTARLKRLYVMEDYRRKGVAQKMLSQLLNFAKQKNYKKIKFSAYPIMENAHQFFKRNGFKDVRGNDIEKFHVEKEL